jgi:hypothetical protein
MTTDRDRSIERLLRQASPADPTAEAAGCPDVETLAALADDTLSAPMRREVEGHIADCYRCQSLTAAMARHDAPGVPAGVGGDVPAWRRKWFNWLVPAAAAATGIALWVLVPGQRPPTPQAPTPDGQVASVPSPPASSEVITSEPLQIPVDSFGDSTAREGDTSRRFETAAPAAPPAPPPPAAAPPPAEPSLKAAAPAVGGVAAAPPSAASAPTAADRSDQSQSATPERRNEVAESEAAAALEEGVLNRRAAPAAGAGGGLPIAARTTGFEVLSPDPRIRWRVGPGPVVQRSTDGGATWATQQTGASTPLTAGSSPAPEVAWLVGGGGGVLRTTDSGRQWQRLRFPEAVDLTAITASTARNATVTLADGRRFTTDDGGMTWTLVR